MSVILETSLGDLTIDLYVDDAPIACKNFLKLCKLKYYNNCIFHNIQKNYLAQTGDPDGNGRGGSSVYGLLYGEQARFFQDEIKPHLKHKEIGTVAMASPGPNLNSSQFYITTAADLDSLDEKHTVFGKVEEGLDTLSKINDAFTNNDGVPLQVIRIRHTIVLEDPFPDPAGLVAPDRSPPPVVDAPEGLLPEDINVKLEDELDEEKQEEIKEKVEKKQAAARAEVLEILGDIPDAEIKPPDNVLFVCKLNPITKEKDLEVIFSKYGKVESVEIIKDHVSGDSLCYGFVEYGNTESAIEAYFKMNKNLIDDRRIHVDFSQSVAKVDWVGAGGWRNYFRNRAKSLNSNKRPPRGGYHQSSLSGLELKNRDEKGNYKMVFDDDDDDRNTDRKKSRRDDGDRRDRNSRNDDRAHRRDDRDRRNDNKDRRDDRDRDRRDDRDRDRDRRDERDRRDRDSRDRDSRSDRDRRRDDREDRNNDKDSRRNTDRRDDRGRDRDTDRERRHDRDRSGRDHS
eukprot:TRINITY_DN4780_c0_g1_i1.p1 TRINITY_DN4780_c0_g1~~TRINITY_DN4780_c0_g1_i1.p1  ORF type:complete len:511 (-),score=128.77 TRINITY_DN4780_c0_g1_i1:143-1675(-)